MIDIASLNFQKGLIPAIVQDHQNGEVLMLAWMNAESLQRTIDTGETWFWSRSRQALWNKGATSGNRQRVVHIATDCDRDTLLITVEPEGPACHTGDRSCFREVPLTGPAQLMQTLKSRNEERPEGSYSASLFAAGKNRILKKVGEEATEVVIAAMNEGRERLTSEIADLFFHLSVLLSSEGMTWEEVYRELEQRR